MIAQKEFRQAGGFHELFHLLALSKSHLEESDEVPVTHNVNLPEEEEENLNELIDISERVRRVAKRLERLKLQGKHHETETSFLLWLRLARKIVHLVTKLMTENEQFKLAFAKDNNGEFTTTLVQLLTSVEDHDLKEKVLSALDTMTTNNSAMQKYIMDILKQQNLLKSILEKLKVDLTGHMESKRKEETDAETIDLQMLKIAQRILDKLN